MSSKKTETVDVPSSDSKILSITLSLSDRLRIIGGDLDVIQALRICVQQTWGWSDILEEYEYVHVQQLNIHEFRLSRQPWLGIAEDAVKSRKMMISIFKTLAFRGWNLMAGVDISKLVTESDTIYFEKSDLDPYSEIFAISLNSTNCIRLIGAPENFGKYFVSKVVTPGWQLGIQQVRDYGGSFEVKLGGDPWESSNHPSQSIKANLLISNTISYFYKWNFKLYGAVNMGAPNTGDMDTLFFRRITQNWPALQYNYS